MMCLNSAATACKIAYRASASHANMNANPPTGASDPYDFLSVTAAA